MKKFPQKSRLSAYKAPNAGKAKPGKGIPYREALRVLLSSMAGLVLANGSMSSNQSGEGDIRCAALPNPCHN